MGGNGTFMKIGWRYILPVWGITLFVLIFSDAVLLNLLLITLSFLTAYLFYVPERRAPETSESAILSPVDGTVLSVAQERGGRSVVIRKKIFDGSAAVRAPVAGELLEKSVTHGLFLKGEAPLASKLNESGTVSWKTGSETVTMKITCGLYSLGLPLFVPENGTDAGDPIAHLSDGVVKLLLPAEVKTEVKPGDRVVGGYSLLAYGAG
ncbi:phosphatidylserine decarboxylase-related protein [Hydrogenimonas sp.]|nr:phosphatidylserine decarboxylase-related protein [Hydrogenimonas sp.]